MIVYKDFNAEDLIIQLKAKRKHAFSVLYDNYAPALLGIATRIVGDKQVGEDLLQEVFVKIWRNIDTYDTSKGTLFTWMLTITRNVSKDYLRSKLNQHRIRTAGNGLESFDQFNPLYESKYRNESHDLPQLIRNLDTKYKNVIDLVYIYGYSQAEVAETLNIPLGTVKTRCREAIKQLRSNYFCEPVV